MSSKLIPLKNLRPTPKKIQEHFGGSFARDRPRDDEAWDERLRRATEGERQKHGPEGE